MMKVPPILRKIQARERTEKRTESGMPDITA